jgi:hypothetical protein
LVDDWIDIVLYYSTLGALKQVFLFGKPISLRFAWKKSVLFLKHRGDVQEGQR